MSIHRDLIRAAILREVAEGPKAQTTIVAAVMEDFGLRARAVGLEVTCLVAFGRLERLDGGRLGLPARELAS